MKSIVQLDVDILATIDMLFLEQGKLWLPVEVQDNLYSVNVSQIKSEKFLDKLNRLRAVCVVPYLFIR